MAVIFTDKTGNERALSFRLEKGEQKECGKRKDCNRSLCKHIPKSPGNAHSSRGLIGFVGSPNIGL